MGKRNYHGCLGIGNTDERFNQKNKFVAVKDLPDFDIKSVSSSDNSI